MRGTDKTRRHNVSEFILFKIYSFFLTLFYSFKNTDRDSPTGSFGTLKNIPSNGCLGGCLKCLDHLSCSKYFLINLNTKYARHIPIVRIICDPIPLWPNVFWNVKILIFNSVKLSRSMLIFRHVDSNWVAIANILKRFYCVLAIN